MSSRNSPSHDGIDALNLKSKDISRELKLLKRGSAATHKRRRVSGFTEHEQYFAVSLYVRNGHVSTVSILFLREKQESRRVDGFDVVTDDALKDLVESWHLAFSDVQLGTIDAPPTPYYKALQTRVKTFVDEYHLRRWVLHQNINKGLAPSTGNMNMRYDAIHRGADYQLEDPANRGDMTKSRNRVWSHRYRTKWELTLGKIPSRDAMDTAVLTEKVILFCGCHTIFFLLTFFLFSREHMLE